MSAVVVLGEWKRPLQVVVVFTLRELKRAKIVVASSALHATYDLGEMAPGDVRRVVAEVPDRFTYTLLSDRDTIEAGPYEVCHRETGEDVVLNCDCDWHLPTAAVWRDLLSRKDGLRMAIHIGDQVYLDLVFKQAMNTLRLARHRGDLAAHRPLVRRLLMRAYLDSWGRPVRRAFLATVPNLMMGDDHDIADDHSVQDVHRGDEVYEFVKGCALEVYTEIQEGLRLHAEGRSRNLYVRQAGDEMRALAGRMGECGEVVREEAGLSRRLREVRERMPAHVTRVTVAISQPLLAFEDTAISRIFYGRSRPVEETVGELAACADILLDLQSELKSRGGGLRVVCGDIHVLQRWDVSRASDGASLEMIVVPPISSCTPVVRRRSSLPLPPERFAVVRRESRRCNGFLTLGADGDRGSARLTRRVYRRHFVFNEMLIGLRLAHASLARSRWPRMGESRETRE